MSTPRILAYLADHPEGATPAQIAEHFEGNAESIYRTLWRLESRFKVKNIGGGRSGIHGMWIGTPEETPPVFRAMETLRAMQEACRTRLTANQLEAA
jgi:hypothetical protein